MYVWVDALTNYITGVGFPDESDPNWRYWPADVHIIGKDIIRFHAVYWPAFLMSAGIALPKQVFGHGFLLNRGEKMSKSIGNVVDPIAWAEIFGVDPLRYYLLREVTFGQDGSYSAESIVARTNADLANSFGNLAQRTLSFIAKNLDGRLPEPGAQDVDRDLLKTIADAAQAFQCAMVDLAPSAAIEAWMRAVFACNAYIDAQAPWALRKTDPARMEAVLATLYEAIASLAIMIQPVIPGSAKALLDQMGVGEASRGYGVIGSGFYSALRATAFTLSPPKPLFPRLELTEADA